MRTRKDEDLLRTEEMAALPLDAIEHEAPPPTVRAPGSVGDTAWLDPR